MHRCTAFFLPLIVCLMEGALPAVSAPAENPARSLTLENGLRVFLYEKRDLPLFNMSVAFNVGAKDESDETTGLTHLLEHCILFRGAGPGGGSASSLEIRRHGGYFNATTGQDLCAFDITLPAEHAEFALRTERDLLFGFNLSPAELEGEIAVILEEINQMEDDPARRATDLVLRHLFEGHPYGRSVYGRREVISSASVEGLRTFWAKHFVPDNAALAAVGDFQVDDMEAKIRAVFGPLPKAGWVPPAIPKAAPRKNGAAVRERMDVQDAYLYLGFPAPDFNHPDQCAMEVLTHVLGRGVNPLLPSALMARRSIVQTLNMSFYANRFGGAVVVSIKLDPKTVAVAEREAVSFLRSAHTENYSKRDVYGEAEFYAYDFLESAKNQIRFAIGQSEESGLALASSLSRFMLLNDREKPGRYLDRVLALKSEDLRRTAAAFLNKNEPVVVTILPKKAGVERR